LPAAGVAAPVNSHDLFTARPDLWCMSCPLARLVFGTAAPPVPTSYGNADSLAMGPKESVLRDFVARTKALMSSFCRGQIQSRKRLAFGKSGVSEDRFRNRTDHLAIELRSLAFGIWSLVKPRHSVRRHGRAVVKARRAGVLRRFADAGCGVVGGEPGDRPMPREVGEAPRASLLVRSANGTL
jgi:hypothetical protein